MLIDLEYALRRHTVQWMLWAIAAGAAVALLTWGGVRWHAAQRSLAAAHAQLNRVQEAPRGADAPPALAPADFTAALPATPPAADVMQTLSRACARSGVTLASVQATSHPPTTALLARTELTVVLRGAYLDARGAVDATLERHPALTLARLRMRRLGNPAELEAVATFSVWGRPVASAASAAAPGERS